MSGFPQQSPGQAGPTPSSAGGGGMRFTPIDPIRILKQYKIILILTVIVGGFLGGILTFVLLKVAPQYTSPALLEVKGSLANPMAVGGGAIGIGQVKDLETFKATQAFFITSPEILRPVLLRNDVKSTQWYGKYNTPDERYEALEDIVSVAPLREAAMIQVSVTTGSKGEAQALCNAVVDQYLTITERINRDQEGRVGTIFTSRRNDLQADVERLRRQANEQMTPSEIGSVKQRLDEVAAVMAGIIREREETAQMLQAAEFALNAMITAQQDQSIDYTPSDYQIVNNDPAVRQTDARIRMLREELRVSGERFGPEHRSVLDIKRRIAAVEQEREKQIAELLRQYKEAQLSELQNSVQSMRSQMVDIQKRAEGIRTQYMELTRRVQQYDAIQQELERRLEELSRYEDSLATIQLLRQDPRANRVVLRSQAERPLAPSFPRFTVMVPMVTFLSIMLVGGFIFLRELLDQRIKGPSCIGLLPHADLLGVIPRSDEDPSGDHPIEKTVAGRPDSLMAETFRQLRTEVVNRMNRRGYKTLMLVGSQPGGGVSSVAVNLAASLAMNDRRVLLIDANFRQPALRQMFALDTGPGLGDLLTGNAQADQIVRPTSIDGLDVVTIGEAGNAALERLESLAFSNLLADMAQRYDMILIDAAPMSVVGDSRLLAGRVDAVMMVIRAMSEKRGMVTRMIRQLDHARAELIGLVLNGVRSSAGGYFRRNYRVYYEYQKAKRPSSPRRKQRV